MIRRTAEDYRNVLDPKRARRDFLYRAALGVVLIVLMVIGLIVYDQEKPAGRAVPARPAEPMPSLAVAPGEPVASERVPEGAEDGLETLDDASAAASELGVTGDDATSAGESVVDSVEIPDEGSPEASDSSPPAQDSTEAAAGEEVARQAEQAAQAAPPGSRNYQIHLGGFMEAEAFAALDAALSGLDYPIVTQFRVSVGPYPERATAGDALSGLRREHALRGIIVPQPVDGSFAVQVGVFAEYGNADALARKLAEWGYPVLIHRRAVTGSFPDRQAAETMQVRLRQERGIESVIVEVPAR